jgi:CRISPR-associated protein Csm3
MKIVTLKGTVEVLTGLHIGGGDDTMKIGGIDNQVIKDINTNKPYIPGSSLKGKMRSLLEWHYGLVHLGRKSDNDKGAPFKPKFLSDPAFADATLKSNAQNLIKLFGASGDEAASYGITRIGVSDCPLIDEGLKTSEAKYENVIDRSSGTANNPRQTERVPVGIKFDFSIRLKVLEGDDEAVFKAMIEKGLELVENDYLGGNGSRGYGRVAFTNRSWS